MDYKLTSKLSQSLKQSDTPANLFSMVELHVPDFEKTKKFYKSLGFEIVWERVPDGFKGYCVLKLENNVICFWGGNENIYQHDYFKKFDKTTPKGIGVELVLQVSDLDSLYEKAKATASIFEMLQKRPWGVRDFRIVDPWGYYLRFADYHNVLSDENAVI